MTEVHVVVPEGIDDPARPSGGNTYDRRVCRELAALGWSVRQHPIAGAWPRAGAAGHAALARAVPRIPDGAVVLLDGLVASPPPRRSCRRRAGCGRSCSCTCRWATARGTARSGWSGRASARSSRRPPPS